MEEYFLTKEDWETIVELGVGVGFSQEAALKAIPTTVKSAFTRAYVKFFPPIVVACSQLNQLPSPQVQQDRPSRSVQQAIGRPSYEEARRWCSPRLGRRCSRSLTTRSLPLTIP